MIVIAWFVAGLVIGFLLRRYKQVAKIAERITPFSVILLVFLLGAGVGADKRIFTKLPTLGLTALLLSLGALAGSWLTAWLVQRYIWRVK